MQEMLPDFILRFGQPCTFEDMQPEVDSGVEAIAPPYTNETENDQETTEEEDKEEKDDQFILNNPANLGLLASESDSYRRYHDQDSYSVE